MTSKNGKNQTSSSARGFHFDAKNIEIAEFLSFRKTRNSNCIGTQKYQNISSQAIGSVILTEKNCWSNFKILDVFY